jgi:hypothetical protein
MREIRILGGSFDGLYGRLVSGFEMYRRPLASNLGIRIEFEAYHSPEMLATALARPGADMVVVMPFFSEDASDLCEQLAKAREAKPGRPLVFLDGHDQTSSPHFPVLPYVDRYIKSKMLRDSSGYLNDYVGGYIFSDYYARQFDFDIGSWQIGSIPDPAFIDRIVPGWNFAVTPNLRRLTRLNRLLPKKLRSRAYDVNARVRLRESDTQKQWYQDYRLRSQAIMNPLRLRLRMTPEARVGRLRFLYELRQSQIVFSPFGWGEVCLRDYEAVASGALLLKPSMSHVATTPDIFVDGQTYVSTKWDLSDLEEKIDWCLSNPEDTQRIASSALRVLRDYFERGGFVEDVRQTLMPLFDRS